MYQRSFSWTIWYLWKCLSEVACESDQFIYQLQLEES